MDDVKEHITYDPDTGLFWWIKNGPKRNFDRPCGSKLLTGYVNLVVNGRQFLAHRLAFLFMGEPLPAYVDHINGVRDDNRWCNLRPTCARGNTYNRASYKNTSGYKGVTWDKQHQKWSAQITFEGKNYNLGRYSCPKEAHKIYCLKGEELHGEFFNSRVGKNP